MVSLSKRLAGPSLIFVLGMIVCWILFRIVSDAVQETVAFDGGMNLQVASSLAHGDGYRRTYAGRPAFPHEVETNAPFLLPAAFVIRLAGVTPATSQLTNIVYLVAFLVGAFLLVRRVAPPGPGIASAWPWMALILCLAIPDLDVFAPNAYGEIPALFWLLAGLLWLFAPPVGRSGGDAARALAGGICVGLAVATKTVLLIGLGAVGLVLLLDGLVSAGSRRQALVRLAVFVGGVAAVLGAIELWRWWSLGSASAYLQWWRDQSGAVLMQAGVRPGFRDIPSQGEKFRTHYSILAQSLTLTPAQLTIFLLADFGVIACALVAWRRHRARALLLAIVFAAVLYLGWWLLITPTEKAWSRRIIDGILLLQIGTASAFAAIATDARARALRMVPAVAIGGLVAVIGINAASTWREVKQLPAREPSDFTRESLAVAARLRELPEDALVFGEGWYSAPAISFYASRPLLDLNDWPLARLPPQPIYLVADTPALEKNTFSAIRAMRESVDLFPQYQLAKIYRVDLARRRDVFAGPVPTGLSSAVDFARGDYPALFGFYSERHAWRWMQAEGQAMLRYDQPAESFSLTVSTPRNGVYVHPGGVHVSVFLNETCVINRHPVRPGRNILKAPLAGPAFTPGEVVRVRLVCDNTLQLRKDVRQLCLIVHRFGFETSPAKPEPARKSGHTGGSPGHLESGARASGMTR